MAHCVYAFTAELANMTEWKEYNGSDEQIDEMQEAQYGVLLSNNPSEIVDVSDMILLESYLNEQDVHEYLICNPHPLAKDFIQWINTGQPVWWRSIEGGGTGLCHKFMPPFAHPDAFEYSFTEFKEEV